MRRVGICALLTLLWVSGLQAAESYHPTFTKMVKRANEHRKAAGLPALTIDAELMACTAKHTKWMATTQSLQHTTAPVAEIIASGQRTINEVMDSWLKSSGHRAILLGNYRYVGAAGYSLRGRTYWGMQFRSTASPRRANAPPGGT